jgi:hypothetical protein
MRRRITAHCGDAGRRRRCGAFRRPLLPRGSLARDALLQQQLGRFDARIGVEPRDEDVVAQNVGDRNERHPLVMCEVGPNDFGFSVAGG